MWGGGGGAGERKGGGGEGCGGGGGGGVWVVRKGVRVVKDGCRNSLP